MSFLIGLAVLAWAALTWAGILDQLNDTLKNTGVDLQKAGVDISREDQGGGQKVGSSPAQTSSPEPDQPLSPPVPQEQPALGQSGLPSGVAYRLQKMNRELEQAEQALKMVYQPAQARHQKATQHLNKALSYQSEIEQGFTGRYDLADPLIMATRNRLDTLKLALAGKPAPPSRPVVKRPQPKGPARPILQRNRPVFPVRSGVKHPRPN